MGLRGWFITFEGIEGSGKSTQIRALARALGRRGHRVLVTREPGGTPAGEAIRRIFLGAAGSGIDPWTEVFLVEAARAEHLARVVRPALANGAIVLCDRFTDSTLAYQGAGRGLPLEPLRRLHAMAALGPPPDLTIVLDVPLRTGLARATERNRSGRRRSGGARLDEESSAFHAR